MVITDLLDEKVFPALELLELYFMRWGIERMFQQVTAVFALRQLIGSTPKATIFQASFCFVLYNLIQVIKGYAAAAGERKVEEVSGEKLFKDVTRELTTWSVAGTRSKKSLATISAPRTTEEVKTRMWQLLRSSWTPLWQKAKLQNDAANTAPTSKFPASAFPLIAHCRNMLSKN